MKVTYCNFLPSDEAELESLSPATLHSFLKFTQKTVTACPQACDCEVGRLS